MCLKDAGFDVLPWPAQSADLIPIELVWNYLKVQFGAREKRPSSIHELWKVILEEWEKVPMDFVRKLIESMPRRVAAVMKAKQNTNDSTYWNSLVQTNGTTTKFYLLE